MKKNKPRDTQVRHRISGAAMLGIKEPTPPTMAVDAAPRAGDVRGIRGIVPQGTYKITVIDSDERTDDK